MRRRSVSSDRYDESTRNIQNRRERRRQTQPIRLAIESNLNDDKSDPINQDNNNTQTNEANKPGGTNLKNSDDSIDLPEPPPSILQINEDKNDQIIIIDEEVEVKKIIKGILETDF